MKNIMLQFVKIVTEIFFKYFYEITKDIVVENNNFFFVIYWAIDHLLNIYEKSNLFIDNRLFTYF